MGLLVDRKTFPSLLAVFECELVFSFSFLLFFPYFRLHYRNICPISLCINGI